MNALATPTTSFTNGALRARLQVDCPRAAKKMIGSPSPQKKHVPEHSFASPERPLPNAERDW